MATKKEIKAVEETRDMWGCLEEHPEMWKEDYLEDVLKLPHEKWPDSECFLCEIWGEVNDEYELICPGCPLSPKMICDTSPNNPFGQWDTGGIGLKERSKQAARIKRACERWLKKNA